MSGAGLTPMQTFEEKVKNRLKETIADMLPDDALAALVQRAVDEQFFKERVYGDQYNRKTYPSWFVEEVADLAKPIIEEHIARAFEERKDEIKKAIDGYIASENLTLLMVAAMSQKLSADLFAHAEGIVNRLRRTY
jgi:hypothetical protein